MTRRATANRGRRATSNRGRCLFARLQVRKTEEVERIGSMLRDTMTDTLCKDGLEERSISRVGISGLWLVRDVADGGLRVAEDIGPLFDLFPEVLSVQRGVGSTVPDCVQD